jgi:glycosyltransferase involved in cell wall biosynthesis
MPTFVRAADALIAVSEHTRADLCDLYQTDVNKVRVIHEGIDAEFRPAPSEEIARVREQYSPGRPYLLMVGTLEPRKNHAAALRALARLKAEGARHRLVIAGGKGWLFEPINRQVSASRLENDVVFAGYVPQADLPALYSGADGVLVPSLYEGFGFPVLEAMACGAPVVASNVSSLPEIAGEAALLVDAEDDAALAAAVQRILRETALAHSLREMGLRRAAEFSWKRCAAETADLYLDIARWA